jgi:hypothetical protein
VLDEPYSGLRDGLAANEADQAGEDQLAAELHDLKSITLLAHQWNQSGSDGFYLIHLPIPMLRVVVAEHEVEGL